VLEVLEVLGTQTVTKKKAYRKTYRFLSKTRAEKYSLFLKKNLLDLDPKYYVVVNRKRVDTIDGVMYALRITTDIECPGFEPIAECWINGSHIYLWRDKCWGIAVDRNGKEIMRYCDVDSSQIRQRLQAENSPEMQRKLYYNKTILLFPIGVDKVE